MANPASTPPCLISLRPAGQHGALRRAAARHGLRVLAVSPWRLQARDDAGTRDALATALAAPAVVFTSPAAVRAAAKLQRLDAMGGTQWLAVGEGTAQALQRVGVDEVQKPTRMDSEGLLALPALTHPGRVGLVTAPGGRGVIAVELARRGAEVLRADVYARIAQPLSAHTLRRLARLQAPWALAVSSGEALQRVFADLPADLRARWQQQPVVVASARLAALANELGFVHVVQAAGPRPAQLVAALVPRSATD